MIHLLQSSDISAADAKSQFQTIFSIFVYSLQPTSLQDLNVLSDVGHELLISQPEDPLKCGSQYGMIQNNNVKVRVGESIVFLVDTYKVFIYSEEQELRNLLNHS